ncbi:MAG: undecaprenyldiphospho-muramoylpentapeptide beta-N-acetylglucosaminyltransferase [Candidatus Falkowbacteria bacterium]|nr:undecaprenyldiphospho-muramoylpentapeptide beta-N-acetylglucosaminyltransferase [Candidatus Falkowbacteria bacterium]
MKKLKQLRKNNKYRIVLSGGGTGGSVTPLLAVADELIAHYDQDVSMLWIGTAQGVERTMVANYPFEYRNILAAKWRRYFSVRNITDLFNLTISFFQSLFILAAYRPQIIITAGSFVSVPVAYAAWFFKIPVLVHQQDIRPGLANKLMAPVAKIITVAFEKSLLDYKKKSIWIGNPIRKEFKDYENINQVKPVGDLPTVLVLGGGTGSESINNLIVESLDDLTKIAKVVHVTGKHNEKPLLNREKVDNYYFYDLLGTAHIARSISEADLVITRAGLGTLSELSFLAKPTIIIPIPNSHQEDNAKYFKDCGAALVLDQTKLDSKQLVKEISNLLAEKELMLAFSNAMAKAMKRNANASLVHIIDRMLK